MRWQFGKPTHKKTVQRKRNEIIVGQIKTAINGGNENYMAGFFCE